MATLDATWKESADIVVLGYGGAGAVVALTAHDLGARVLIVEKQPAATHYTSTQMSGGAVVCPDDEEATVRYMQALYQVEEGWSWTDAESLRVWAHYTGENKAWLERLGLKLKLAHPHGEHAHLPGAEAVKSYRILGCGYALHKALTREVAKRRIPVLYDAPAQKLLTDAAGGVVGVRVAGGEGGQSVDLQAKRAVVLATGGFEFDEAMKLNFMRVYPTYFTGTTACTGDGVRMAMEVGADLWHMNCCAGRWVAKYPDFPIAFSMSLVGQQWERAYLSKADKSGVGDGPPPTIVVDRDGKRFTSENFKMHAVYYELAAYDSQRLRYPRVPCYWIFDQRRIDGGPLPLMRSGAAGPVQLYRWSRDNRVELERGWITAADSVAALAEKIGLPAANLVETVERYNGYCRQGRDPEFGLNPTHLTPLSNPPFYAVALYPGGPNTQGGPRRNSRCQVVGVDGSPIPGLYAAGELGSLYGMIYPQGGGNLAECIAMGRVAAENAVREARRG